MTTWHLAICLTCTPLLPQPFSDSSSRDDWSTAHKQATGHDVRHIQQDQSVEIAAATESGDV